MKQTCGKVSCASFIIFCWQSRYQKSTSFHREKQRWEKKNLKLICDYIRDLWWLYWECCWNAPHCWSLAINIIFTEVTFFLLHFNSNSIIWNIRLKYNDATTIPWGQLIILFAEILLPSPTRSFRGIWWTLFVSAIKYGFIHYCRRDWWWNGLFQLNSSESTCFEQSKGFTIVYHFPKIYSKHFLVEPKPEIRRKCLGTLWDEIEHY